MESSNKRKTKSHFDDVSLDTVQFIFARGVKLHPLLYKEFLKQIIELEHKNKVCPLPITHLQHFSNRIVEKLALNQVNSLKIKTFL